MVLTKSLSRVLLAVAVAACVALAFLAGQWDRPARQPDFRSTPGVITAVRDLSTLETASFHVEKVIEATDEQSRLWGMVQAKDALLLVAVGDVVAGVDLGKVRDENVRVDPATHALHVSLPAAQVISSSLDERATHVYTRTTDVLAERNEKLEGDARRRAEEQMRKAAIDGGLLDRARANADRALRALFRSLGFTDIELEWGSA
jgi:hypothetical protein